MSAETTNEDSMTLELTQLRAQVSELQAEVKSLEAYYKDEITALADEMASEISDALEEGYALGFAKAEAIAAEKDAALGDAIVEIQEDYEMMLDAHRADINKIVSRIADDKSIDKADNVTRLIPEANIMDADLETEEVEVATVVAAE